MTKFQQKVYGALKRIPRGRVTTYGLLAKEVGCGSARAVGQALKHNPDAPTVPCHRVIRSDLTLGGYSGSESGADIRRKVRLLKQEGVAFEGGRLANPKQLFRFGA